MAVAWLIKDLGTGEDGVGMTALSRAHPTYIDKLIYSTYIDKLVYSDSTIR